jgi:hypothetical protein
MLRHSFSILGWLLDLFNAPPRESMTRRQKVGRMLLVSGTLVILCILGAMVGAVGIFVLQRLSRALSQNSDLWNTAAVIIVGVGVNALCVFILFQVKKFDRRLMQAPGETPARS